MSTQSIAGKPKRVRAKKTSHRKHKKPAGAANAKHPAASTMFASGVYARWLRRGQ